MFLFTYCSDHFPCIKVLAFAINSLLYDPHKRIIIDYFDGFKDIKNKKIKVIGDPKKRFIEDPMRIIRIIRISSKLNLQKIAFTYFRLKQIVQCPNIFNLS